MYGTLKTGFGNHHLIENQSYIGHANTIEKYNMMSYVRSSFPILLEHEQKAYTAGELYDIDDEALNRVDRLESNGSFYQRKQIKVVCGCAILPAWCYFIIPYNEESLDLCDSVEIDNMVQRWTKR